MTPSARSGGLCILLGIVVPVRAMEMRVLTMIVLAEIVGLRAVHGTRKVEASAGARHRYLVEEDARLPM
jgi:hypothetical protein